MTARVLVVDDILANVKLLEARLTAEYFDVIAATNGREALDLLAREKVDVVLLDVMMPGMDGFEVCRRIKADPHSAHIPVVMVTALDQPSDKLQGLEAGADDFLTKPVDDVALITRVKNLARLKVLSDEMMMRASTSEKMGMGAVAAMTAAEQQRGRVLIVEDHARSGQRLLDSLSKSYDTVLEREPQQALVRAAEQGFDVALVSLNLAASDGLRLCSQLRSVERTRHLPIVIMVEPGDDVRLLRGLDMGVNDYLMRPIDRNEMQARLRSQIRRKRHSDFLRTRLEESVEHAVTDALTGLNNRRYLETHLKTLVADAQAHGRQLAVLLADIDYFKSVNDTYGHDAGDLVLKEFAARLRRNTRGVDLACRLGGEEFVLVMPDTDQALARQVGERLRTAIAVEPFQISSTGAIRITASVGVATLDKRDDTGASLLKRADLALYSAKRNGRNRVVSEAT